MIGDDLATQGSWASAALALAPVYYGITARWLKASDFCSLKAPLGMRLILQVFFD